MSVITIISVQFNYACSTARAVLTGYHVGVTRVTRVAQSKSVKHVIRFIACCTYIPTVRGWRLGPGQTVKLVINLVEGHFLFQFVMLLTRGGQLRCLLLQLKQNVPWKICVILMRWCNAFSVVLDNGHWSNMAHWSRFAEGWCVWHQRSIKVCFCEWNNILTY